MLFFYFILILFILLITITISSSLIEFALNIVVKQKYKQYRYIIPSFFSCLLWVLIFALMQLFLTRVFNINILTIFIDEMVYKTVYHTEMLKVILTFVITSVIGILLQAAVFLTINIDCGNLIKKIKYKLNIKIKEDEEEKELVINNKQKLNYGNALITSLFLYSIILFAVLILLSIGSNISKKFI